jgi:Mg2+-importing ATPase
MLTPKDLNGFTPWSMQEEELLSALQTSRNGLSEREGERRQKVFGLNELVGRKKQGLVIQYLLGFFNPLQLLLICASIASYVTGNELSAAIIFFLSFVSVTLTFLQEYTANEAADRLRKMIRNTASVVRGGVQREIPLKFLVPGDIIRLSAGDLVPADCRLLFAKDLFVNQGSLTGESVPVEKNCAPVSASCGVLERPNMLYLGSSVVSGSGLAVVVKTGVSTQFGELAKRLERSGAETAFDRGIKEFSLMLVRLVLVLVVVIFFINAFMKNNVLEAFLFALAVAVGLTPEMLPVMVTANLSQGAVNMSKKGVIVKRLPSIQNLGAMDVLCTDKTGTLTEDKIRLVRHVNLEGKEDDEVLGLAYLNSLYQTGLRNPLDAAIMQHDIASIADKINGFSKIDEIPFDFMRRRMSVVVQRPDKRHMFITKGAPESIIPACKYAKRFGKKRRMAPSDIKKAQELYNQLSEDGFRVLALASKRVPKEKKAYCVADESDLCFEGFVAFLDPPKKTAPTSLAELVKRGVEVKILSGDNELVNRKIAHDVGLKIKGIITGAEIDKASDESLSVLVEQNTIFARVSPIQKERIILALQRNKHVVGFLGDGINDALALKTSDVGISVDSAADVAKESADIILLRKSLHVLYEGVDEGRRTFSNIMKYLKMGTSSNFGNMFSVVGASIFLPFLPMTPLQLILNNFLYDISQLGIPTDNVDPEDLVKPAKWSTDFIRNFVVYVGPISSIFDYLTFGILLFVFAAPAAVFQTGWFLESIATQTLIIHIIRTNKVPFLQSQPSKKLLILSLFIVAAAFFVALSPLKLFFGFSDLPLAYFPVLFAIVLIYLVLAQLVKSQLVKRKLI